ncbi:hypothetical protein CBR_g6413 [Chara braunii]|uniref:Uncharacterized protein n=1 Tax=Chara braunii TaxID=69332 RepID=A0A388KJT5_CHABU|nr:hypothetical protein CBR_g6413 [Chara braunii]|eukprot:GBG70286.1 hypothetical protein CBR_g6413 [Chara braunii]
MLSLVSRSGGCCRGQQRLPWQDFTVTWVFRGVWTGDASRGILDSLQQRWQLRTTTEYGGERTIGRLVTAGLVELEAKEWLTIIQVSTDRVHHVVAKLRAVVSETTVPSISWIRSEQQRLLEITWGLEEGLPPRLRMPIVGSRLESLMRKYYDVLDEGQDLCAQLGDRWYDDDTDLAIADASDIASCDNGELICTTVHCNNSYASRDNANLTCIPVCYNNNNNNNNTDKSSDNNDDDEVCVDKYGDNGYFAGAALTGAVDYNDNNANNMSTGDGDNNISHEDNNNDFNNNNSKVVGPRACTQLSQGVRNEGGLAGKATVSYMLIMV